MAACNTNFGGGRPRKNRGRRGRGGGVGDRNLEGLENKTPESKSIPQDQIEPLKVYVGNLRLSVSDHELKNVFSHYAKVVHAFVVRDKHTYRSRGFGFVQVETAEDVEKLLSLKDGDRYICGQRVYIKPAIKKAVQPGDHDYVRIPMSDRLFDLEPEDPSSPCVHVLVDDVIFKIFEMLPLKTLIGVERVCRRWQMLIHKLFAARTSLNICRETIGLCGPLTKSIIAKLLILSGPTLRELKVQNVDYSTRHNILRMIAQLCPELESIDVTQAMGINFSNLKYLTKGCRKLKTFIAERCPDFDDRSLKEVLQSYPDLEHLNINSYNANGTHFKLLPASLKVLKLNFSHGVSPENIKVIGGRCPNLQVLNIHQIICSKAVLDHIGTCCKELQELKVSITSQSAAEALVTYKNLKTLDITAETPFEIFPVIEHLSELEVLSIKAGNKNLTERTKLNFSAFKHLKEVSLARVDISTESLKTLSKCRNLKVLQLLSGVELDSDLFLNTLRGCPELLSFSTLSVTLNQELLNAVNDIMVRRTGQLTLSMCLDNDIEADHYDSQKIKLEGLSRFLQYADDSDFDDIEDYDNDSIFSGDSLDEYWMYGYGSDGSLLDDFVYPDHFAFLDRHLGVFELGLDEDIFPYLFD